VDSVDDESFYCGWRHPADRIRRHQRYEEYLLGEVLPLSERLNGRSALIAHGCSLGSYHAVNVALRHPSRFVKAVGLSGRYDLTQKVEDFPDLLGGYHDELVYFHMPSQYVPNLTDPWVLEPLRRLHVVLAVGEHDPFLGSNVHLAGQLAGRGVRAELHRWQGRAHKPCAWREMVRLYL
jgi:esterase/lipase superfamily enzyme